MITRRKPIKRISNNRRRSMKAWREITREAISDARDYCLVQAIGCSNYATEGHHRLPRSLGGKDELSNCVAVCSSCHRYIHDNREWARAAGWLLPAKEGE